MADKWAQYQTGTATASPPAPDKWTQYQDQSPAVTSPHGVTGSWESNASPGRGGAIHNLASTPLSNASINAREDQQLAASPLGGFGPMKLATGVSNVLTSGRRARGVSQIIHGAAETATPLLPEALLAAPMRTIAAMILSNAAGEAGKNVSTRLGAGPETSNAVSDLSSLLTLTPMGEGPVLPFEDPRLVEKPPNWPSFMPGGPGTTRPNTGGVMAGIRAATPDFSKGAGKVAIGLSGIKLLPGAGKLLGDVTAWSGAKQMGKGLGAGWEAFKGPVSGAEPMPEKYKFPGPTYIAMPTVGLEPGYVAPSSEEGPLLPDLGPQPASRQPSQAAQPAAPDIVDTNTLTPSTTLLPPIDPAKAPIGIYPDGKGGWTGQPPPLPTPPAPLPVDLASSSSNTSDINPIQRPLTPDEIAFNEAPLVYRPSEPMESIPPPALPKRPFELSGSSTNPADRASEVTAISAIPPAGGIPVGEQPHLQDLTPAPPSPEYQAALDKARQASDTYRAAAAAYRAGTISTDEYLAARAARDKADASFDSAFDREGRAAPAPQDLTPAPVTPVGNHIEYPAHIPERLRGAGPEVAITHASNATAKDVATAASMVADKVTPEQFDAMSDAAVYQKYLAPGGYKPFGSDYAPGRRVGRDAVKGRADLREALVEAWDAQQPMKPVEPGPVVPPVPSPVAPPAPLATPAVPATPADIAVAARLRSLDWTPEDIDAASDDELDAHYRKLGYSDLGDDPAVSRANLRQALTSAAPVVPQEVPPAVAPTEPKLPAGQESRRVSIGLVPGHGTLFEKAGVKEVPLDAAWWSVQQIARKAGVRITGVDTGTGVYRTEAEPSMHVQVEGTPAQIQQFMDAVGYGLQQTEVWGTKASPTASGYAFDVTGKDLDTDEARVELYNDIRSELQSSGHEADALIPGFQPTSVDGNPGIRFLQYDTHMDPATLQALGDAVTAARPEGIATRHGTMDIMATGNDWKERPNGEDYTSRLQRSANGIRQYMDGEHRRALWERIRPAVPKGAGEVAPGSATGEGSGSAGSGQGSERTAGSASSGGKGSGVAPAPKAAPLPKTRAKFDAAGRRNDLKPGKP